MATTISSLTPTTTSTTSSSSDSSSSDTSSLLSTATSGTISSLGAGSGLDLSGLLTKLVNAEKAPEQAIIDQQTSTVNAEISALGTLQSKLTAFQTALANLKDTSDFNSKTATSSDTSLFTATAVTTADVSSYKIGVISVAQANKIASANFASQDTSVGSGTLTIGVGGKTFDVAITAGVNDSVAQIRDAINSAPNNTGVKASLLTVSNGSGGTAVKLVLTSTSTGAASQISVSTTDSDGNNTDASGLSQLYYSKSDTTNSRLSEINAAQDAQITVDGFTATSSTNTFSNTIPGVTITALKGATDPLNPPTGQLSIGVDTSSAAKSVQAFVDAYNDLATTFKQLAGYDTTTQTAGPLFGDSSVSLIQSRIQQALTSPVSGAASDLNNLALIGITTNADGTLSFDTDKFSSVTDGRFADLGKLFAGTTGVAGQLDSLINQFTSSGGTLSAHQQALSDQLQQLKDQQTALDARIADFQTRTQAQFAALDAIVQQLNQTSSYLTQQFDAINNTGSSSKS
jgi:flagellar hook-associated protein 2